MEANKCESEKCIQVALRAAKLNDYEKTLKFLNKAKQLYPSDQIDALLKDYSERAANFESQSENAGSNSANNSFTSGQSGEKNASNSNKEESSAEQIEAVKKIKNCRDFYEILGVPKTATETDLKKAYKKQALKFHPDKNKTTGAAEAFKAIGKAFAILSDAEKRKQYDNLGPDSFEGESSGSTETSRRHRHTYHYNAYWNDDDFSADELFNLFFGGGNYATSQTHRRRQATQHHTNSNNSFVFSSSSNNYAVLFQLMPILLIIILSLLSNFMIGEPLYSLQKTNKYNVKRTTNDHQIVFYVKPDFKVESSNELNKIEKQVEEDFLVELRQACFREKSYKETAIWRARNYGDERLLKKAYEYETPSCNRINHIFGGG